MTVLNRGSGNYAGRFPRKTLAILGRDVFENGSGNSQGGDVGRNRGRCAGNSGRRRRAESYGKEAFLSGRRTLRRLPLTVLAAGILAWLPLSAPAENAAPSRERALLAGRALGNSIRSTSFDPETLKAREEELSRIGGGSGKDRRSADLALGTAADLLRRERGSEEKRRLSRERRLYTAAMELPEDADEMRKGAADASSCLPRERLSFREIHCPPSRKDARSCLIVHAFRTGMVEPDPGTGISFRPCPESVAASDSGACYEFWMGDTRDSSLSGNCSIFEAETGFTVKFPENVRDLTLSEVFYDDYLQLWGNTGRGGKPEPERLSQANGTEGDAGAQEDDAMEKLMSFPNDDFPPETPGPCELGQSRHEYPGRDIWPYFKRRLRPGEPLRVRLRQRVSVTGNGEGYMLFRIRFNSGALDMDEYRGLDCLSGLPREGLWTLDCQRYAAEVAPGYYWAGIMPAGRSLFEKPREFAGPFADLWDPFCLEGTVRESSGDRAYSENRSSCPALDLYRYCERQYGGGSREEIWRCSDQEPCTHAGNPYLAELRGEDTAGTSGQTGKAAGCTRTFRDITVPEDGLYHERVVCSVYQDDDGQGSDGCAGLPEAGCVLAGRECLDSEKNPDEFCSLQTLVWDCPREYTAGRKLRETVLNCPGTDLGTGTSLTGTLTGEAGDLTGAMLALQLMNYMQDDIVCTGTDASKTADCRIFRGEMRECREGYHGKMRCCTDGAVTDITDYVRLTAYTMSIKAALGAVRSLEPAFGSWARREALRDSTGFISSALDSIVADTGKATAQAAAEGFTEAMTRKLADFVAETFGEEFRNAVFTEGVNEAGAMTVQLNETVVACASWAMTAYVAWQLTHTAFKMLTSCRAGEQETALRIGLKSCVYQGSSCSVKVLRKCLVHKRRYCCYSSPLARIAMSRPEVQEMAGEACGGIPLSRLGELDLSTVDLSEWGYYLDRSGLLPDGEYSLERLTGSGSALSTGNRDNAAVRTVKRLEGADSRP